MLKETAQIKLNNKIKVIINNKKKESENNIKVIK